MKGFIVLSDSIILPLLVPKNQWTKQIYWRFMILHKSSEYYVDVVNCCVPVHGFEGLYLMIKAFFNSTTSHQLQLPPENVARFTSRLKKMHIFYLFK